MTWLSRLLRTEAAPVPVAAPEPPPRPAPVNWAQILALAMGDMPTAPRIAHRVYQPLKGVVPEGHALAMDNAVSSIDWANQAQTISYGNALNSAFAEGLIFPGYPYLAELAQRPEYRRGAEIWATEMTREWISFGSKKEGDDKAERIDGILEEIDRFKLRDVFRRAEEIDGLMGRAQIYLDVGSRNEATPLLLTPETVKRGALKAFTVVEPMWSYPVAYNAINPLLPDFYKPPGWYVMGKEVSASRLVTFVGREVPDLLKPSYAFGGLSLTQMAKPYVDNWLRTRQSVADLVSNFSKVGLATDMGAQTGDGCDPNSLNNRMAYYNLVRSNRGIMLTDKSTEEMFELSTPLAGLNDLQWSTLQFVCSVNGIPPLIYLQLSPSGLNTDSDGVVRQFYDGVHARQEDKYRDPLRRCIDLIQLNRWGNIDPDITFSFNPLWQMSDKEKAEIRKIDADTEAVYIGQGVLDPQEVRERLAADGAGVYTNINPADLPETPGFDDDATGEIGAQEAEGGGDNAG